MSEAGSKRVIERALQAVATQALKVAATGPFIALGIKFTEFSLTRVGLNTRLGRSSERHRNDLCKPSAFTKRRPA